jgi:hypothetical protein
MMKVLKWLAGICATLFGLLLVAFIAATMTIRSLTRVASLALMTLLVVVVALGQENEEVGANDPVRLGPESAATTIEVFIDYQCPSCAAMYPRLKELHSKHPKPIAIIYRHIPLSIHDKAMIAAQAVEAARIQGKGVQMADMILTNQHLWANDPKTKTFGGYAKRLGWMWLGIIRILKARKPNSELKATKHVPDR